MRGACVGEGGSEVKGACAGEGGEGRGAEGSLNATDFMHICVLGEDFSYL